jgi:hypothetical protein
MAFLLHKANDAVLLRLPRKKLLNATLIVTVSRIHDLPLNPSLTHWLTKIVMH